MQFDESFENQRNEKTNVDKSEFVSIDSLNCNNVNHCVVVSTFSETNGVESEENYVCNEAESFEKLFANIAREMAECNGGTKRETVQQSERDK